MAQYRDVKPATEADVSGKLEALQRLMGQHLWARGYFVASSGNVTDEIIKAYIQNQDLQEKRNTDNFEIG